MKINKYLGALLFASFITPLFAGEIYSVDGIKSEVTAKNKMFDFVKGNCGGFIDFNISDDTWEQNIILPQQDKSCNVIKVTRTSTLMSYIKINSSFIPIPLNTALFFSFDGDKWRMLNDIYNVGPVDGKNVELSDGYNNIQVDISVDSWSKFVTLPKKPASGDVVVVSSSSAWETTVIGPNTRQKVHSTLNATYVFKDDAWISSLGSSFEIDPIEGEDLQLPNGQIDIKVDVRDTMWTRLIHLPTNPAVGTVVMINRTSTWDTYAKAADLLLLIPPSSISTIIWDGMSWVNTSVESGLSISLKNKGMYNIKLNKTQAKKINSISTNITSITEIDSPAVVDLQNIYIENGTIINNTPYTINSLNFLLEGKVIHIELNYPLSRYSSGYIGSQWDAAQVLHMAALGNNHYDFRGAEPRGQARFANEEERSSVERVQMYEKYWLNAPNTLAEILALVASQCHINSFYSECHNYEKSMMDYTSDMYFSQSVSGQTSTFWIDPTVWGLAAKPDTERVKSYRSITNNLWMSPVLMSNMLSNDATTAIDAEQGLVHEYYHNLGFSHNSGWPSSNGVDDLFGVKAYKTYRTSLGDEYFTSNLAVTAEKVSDLEFIFNLEALGEANDLNMRILSSQNLTAKVHQSNSNKLILKFDEQPSTDVYVSFYSKDSSQMATKVLNNFVGSVSTQLALSNLPSNFEKLVGKFNRLFIHTADGSWVRDFYLPKNVEEGKVVIFNSSASWNSNVYYDDKKDILSKGVRLEYYYSKGRWEKQ